MKEAIFPYIYIYFSLWATLGVRSRGMGLGRREGRGGMKWVKEVSGGDLMSKEPISRAGYADPQLFAPPPLPFVQRSLSRVGEHPFDFRLFRSRAVSLNRPLGTLGTKANNLLYFLSSKNGDFFSFFLK